MMDKRRKTACAFALLATCFLLFAGCHDNVLKSRPQMNDSTIMMVDSIRQDSTFYLTRGVGMAGTEKPQWEWCNRLGRHAGTEVLYWLAGTDSSLVVRLCAYRQLRRKSGQKAVAFYQEHINDSVKVTLQSGCIVYDAPFVEAIEAVNSMDHDQPPLAAVWQNQLDSLQFFSNRQADLLQNPWFLGTLRPRKVYYSKLRTEVAKGNYAPVAALAKYHRTADIPLIERVLKTMRAESYDKTIAGLAAVENWPHKSFAWFVQEQCREAIDGESSALSDTYLIPVLLAYPEPWSYRMLQHLMGQNMPKEDLLTFGIELKDAYEKHPQPYFKPLYDKYCAHIKLRPVSEGVQEIITE